MKTLRMIAVALALTACGKGAETSSEVMDTGYGMYEERTYTFAGDKALHDLLVGFNGQYYGLGKAAGFEWSVQGNGNFPSQFHGIDFPDLSGHGRPGGPVVTSTDPVEWRKMIELSGKVEVLSDADRQDLWQAGVKNVRVIVTVEYAAKPYLDHGKYWAGAVAAVDNWATAQPDVHPGTTFEISERPYGEWFAERVERTYDVSVDEARLARFSLNGRWVQLQRVHVLILKKF